MGRRSSERVFLNTKGKKGNEGREGNTVRFFAALYDRAKASPTVSFEHREHREWHREHRGKFILLFSVSSVLENNGGQDSGLTE